MTLAARDEAADREEAVYGQAWQRWLEWLRSALDEERISVDDIRAGSKRFARVFPEASDDEVYERGSVPLSAARFRARFPALMNEFASERLTERQQEILRESWDIQDSVRDFDGGPNGWSERKTEIWAGAWPEDVALVQVADGPNWGTVTSYGAGHGFHPPLADDRFVGVLRRAGETRGWHVAPIDLRARDWTLVSTHQPIFVADSISLNGIKSSFESSPGAFWEHAYVKPETSSTSASILRGDHGLYLGPAASDALAAAKLRGIELVPLRYEDEVPKEARGYSEP